MPASLLKCIAQILLIPFTLTSLYTDGIAQNVSSPLISSNNILELSAPFTPPLLTGMTIHPTDPWKMHFIVNTGDTNLAEKELIEETEKMAKYFLAALAIPDDELWVNLSPDEPDRILPDSLAKTAMGSTMLAQDYLLKQMTASLLYPESHTGQTFWNNLYSQLDTKDFDLPVNLFNKVWIVPQDASVYIHNQHVLVTGYHLKVMLEEDYLALEHHSGIAKATSNQSHINPSQRNLLRQHIIPVLEQEINHGQHFAPLRQIMNAMVLGKWYKDHLHNSILAQTLGESRRVAEETTPAEKQNIFQDYVQLFTKGVFDHIQEDYDPIQQTIVNRKFISGGVVNFKEVIDSRDIPSDLFYNPDRETVFEMGLNFNFFRREKKDTHSEDQRPFEEPSKNRWWNPFQNIKKPDHTTSAIVPIDEQNNTLEVQNHKSNHQLLSKTADFAFMTIALVVSGSYFFFAGDVFLRDMSFLYKHTKPTSELLIENNIKKITFSDSGELTITWTQNKLTFEELHPIQKKLIKLHKTWWIEKQKISSTFDLNTSEADQLKIISKYYLHLRQDIVDIVKGDSILPSDPLADPDTIKLIAEIWQNLELNLPISPYMQRSINENIFELPYFYDDFSHHIINQPNLKQTTHLNSLDYLSYKTYQEKKKLYLMLAIRAWHQHKMLDYYYQNRTSTYSLPRLERVFGKETIDWIRQHENDIPPFYDSQIRDIENFLNVEVNKRYWQGIFKIISYILLISADLTASIATGLSIRYFRIYRLKDDSGRQDTDWITSDNADSNLLITSNERNNEIQQLLNEITGQVGQAEPYKEIFSNNDHLIDYIFDSNNPAEYRITAGLLLFYILEHDKDYTLSLKPKLQRIIDTTKSQIQSIDSLNLGLIYALLYLELKSPQDLSSSNIFKWYREQLDSSDPFVAKLTSDQPSLPIKKFLEIYAENINFVLEGLLADQKLLSSEQPEPIGGIDLSPNHFQTFNFEATGDIKFPIANPKQIQTIQFDFLKPVVDSIKPINMPMLLGINTIDTPKDNSHPTDKKNAVQNILSLAILPKMS